MTESREIQDDVEAGGSTSSFGSRKEKRKALKKEKRKQIRKELAEKAREAELARLADPEEQRRLELEEEREKERVERERKEFEERERIFLEELARKREEEERERKDLEEELERNQARHGDGPNEDDDWEYVEEGPPEIIWKGNEIIVKKNRIRVKKKDAIKKDANRPTSNPLPPQSEAFADHHNTPVLSAQQLLENVAQQVPNFGTEQDKDHCPFHIKTGACRFGVRCSRVHFYPDKSCTLLMKNMYNGPGLAWEQDEGLEYTEEEVERCYEEFYEDVHTEFLKYGEIVNFKVCRNGAFHLRGNLYVHYKSPESALMAYQSMNGRYFAGKQVKCEFVGVTRWKIAICGEYMKSRLKTCSRGTACNFIHCFRNPGGDYEWADWDKPPPRYWMDKMIVLFGYPSESGCDKHIEQENFRQLRKSSKTPTEDDRYHSWRSQSTEGESSYGRSRKSRDEEDNVQKSTHRHRAASRDGRKHQRPLDEKSCNDANSESSKHGKTRTYDTDSDGDCSDKDRNRVAKIDRTGKSSRHHYSEVQELREYHGGSKNRHHNPDSDREYSRGDLDRDRRRDHKRRSSSDLKQLSERHGDPSDRTIDRDKDWSNLDRDGDEYHDRTRKRHRHSDNEVKEYSEYYRANSKTHETDSNGDLSDSDVIKERHQGRKIKSSRNAREVSGVLNDLDDSKNRSNATDFDGDRLHKDRIGESEGHSRRRGSKSRKKVSVIHEDYVDNKNGVHAAGS